MNDFKPHKNPPPTVGNSFDRVVTRRGWLRSIPSLLVPPMMMSCALGSPQSMLSKTKIKLKYHWARREEWTGLEVVAGVVRIGDRYLLVKRVDGLGWTFPGGLVDSRVHGEKKKDNKDLIRAVLDYVHSEALIGIVGNDAVLLAYGYALNSVTNKTLLQHWFAIGISSSFPPVPNANLREVVDAKWVALDDPVLGDCLRQRIKEYTDIGAGGTVILESFQVG